MMNFDLRRNKITASLIVFNLLYFLYTRWKAGTLSGPGWTFTLLDLGALFNPYALDGGYWRLLAHMFLHGHIPHLLVNLYALFSVGRVLEPEIGSTRFLVIYLICGLASGIASLWWSLFQVSVGASGAIFGLFGFSLILNIKKAREEDVSIGPILTNFFIFLALNLIFAKALQADTAAHLGGLACGIIMAGYHAIRNERQHWEPEALVIMILLACLYLLPRDQVHYFKFFQRIRIEEDSTKALYNNAGMTNAVFAEGLKRINKQWDETEKMLTSMKSVPTQLHHDTTVLRKYIHLREREANYRIQMIEKESYIYLDSIEVVVQENNELPPIEYPLNMKAREEVAPPETPLPAREQVKVFFDSLWNEKPYPPGSYYRIGYRDSLNQWDGPLTDFYADGTIQMKGTYHKNKQDGIFIYYTKQKRYEAAGRSRDGRRVGKWETFYPNGQMQSEVFYSDNVYMRTLWDSTGRLLIKNGEGEQITYHQNGKIAERGFYKGGLKEGNWIGYYPDGSLYFEENYRQNRLVFGRSRSKRGETVTYDQSSFYPIPKNGFKSFYNYVHEKVLQGNYDQKGTVEISFRVTRDGLITNVEIEKSLTPFQDEVAKRIILDGPPWFPGKDHGLEPAESYGFVKIEF